MTVVLPALESALSVVFKLGAGDAASRKAAAAILGEGWSEAEPDYTWTLGTSSAMHLVPPDGPGDYFLQLRVTPLLVGRPNGQRLRVIANGFELADLVLERTRTVTLFLPGEVFERKADLDIELQHPDAVRVGEILQVADTRQLAIGLHLLRLLRVVERAQVPLPAGARLPASERDMLMGFEALGTTPEFGLVQRRHGADPLGLLRFTDIGLDALLDMLEGQFASIADPGALSLGYATMPEGGATYQLTHHQYGMVYRTLVPVSGMDPQELLRRETSRLMLTARKMVQTLNAGTMEDGDKILVVRTVGPLEDDALIPLMCALTAYGPNMVLWVTDADADHPLGSVEPLMHGLLRGHVRAATAGKEAGADGADDDGWLAVCRAAWMLWRAARGDTWDVPEKKAMAEPGAPTTFAYIAAAS